MMMMNDPHPENTQHMKKKEKETLRPPLPPSNKKQFRPRPLPPPRSTLNINIIHSIIPSSPPPPLLLPHPQSPLKILLKPLHTPDIDRIAQHLPSSSPPTPTQQQLLMQIVPPQQNRQQRKSQRTLRTRNFQTRLESFRIERFFFF